MANTKALVEEVEPFIREWLRKRFDVTFSRKKVPIGAGAFHEFGAVSDDGTIVAAIRRSSGKTSGDKFPSGKIQLIFKDVHLLSLAQAKTKALVITDPEFLGIVKKETLGKLPQNVQLLYCPLPPHLEAIVQSIRQSASDEMN